MYWYTKLPDRWLNEQTIASRLLEHSRVEFDAERAACLLGGLSLISAHGHLWDTFQIRIVYPSDFLKRGRGPSVYLDSHRDRWKNGGDTHIEPDWRLCLFVPSESGIDWFQGDALEHLVACVRTFLAKERFFQRDLAMHQATGKIAHWPGASRSHGVDGIREALTDRRAPMGRNDPCPCGSGLKFKKCCLPRL